MDLQIAFTLLAALLHKNTANYCTPMNQFVDKSFIESGGDIPGFRFPPNIRRTFPGVVDRQCGPPHPIINPQPHTRDGEFCLPHNPFNTNNPEMVCNRCEPGPENFYKFEIWRHINTIDKELNHWKEWDIEAQEFRFPFGFCLTCYALAAEVPGATPDDIRNGKNIRMDQPFFKGIEYPLPAQAGKGEQMFEGTDVKKDSVTVTTRVACGKQREDGMFDAPTPAMLESFDKDLKKYSPNATDPCDHPMFPCGEGRAKRNAERAKKLGTVKQELDEKIMEYIKLDENGEAVNGHHEALMEIPFGKAHVLRTSINLNTGFKGFTLGIRDGGYESVDEKGNVEGYSGCQAIEYGMVALSPGKVDTACWLVPLKTTGKGQNRRPDRQSLKEWMENEVKKEAIVQKSFKESQGGILRNILKYCRRFRRRQPKQTPMHEFATSFCERHFCIPQSFMRQKHRRYHEICTDSVFIDAEDYKAEARRRMQEFQMQNQEQQQGAQQNQQQNAWVQSGNLQQQG